MPEKRPATWFVVADAREAAAAQILYDRLVVVAPPRAPGKRDCDSFAGGIAKDLTDLSDHDLPAHPGCATAARRT